jgi:serine/threonine protein kinase
MAAYPAVHPSEDALRAFALGKLDDSTSSVLMSHLDACPDCCKVVAALSGDDFLDRLRQAHGRSSTPAPAKSLADVAGKALPPANQTPIPNLPPELAANEQYEILRELGRGGMGVVYLAKNKLMDRLEVLKVINKKLLDHPGAIERFLREIRSAAKLSHANVVGAYSAVQSGDLLAFAMEYVEGQDLASLVKSRGPLPVVHACYYVQQAALGLQHAHEEKMVHRDIKPQNLILTHKGKKHTVKVLDFGLAKATREKAEETGLTGEGAMLGTPDYVAPEQTLDAAKADIRADVYSLGCTLYYLLSGAPPFKGRSLYEVLQAHHTIEARPLNLVRPEVPEELAAVVRKMMAKSPAKRYQTPLEVVQALAPFVKQGTTPKSSPELSSGVVEAKSAVKKAARVDPPPTPFVEAVKKQPEPEAVWESLSDQSIVPVAPRKSGAIRKRRAATVVRERTTHKKWLIGGIGVGALLLALLGMLAAGVFKVKTKDGTIVLENLPPDAEVLIDREKVTVTWGGDGKTAEIHVKPGTHKIVASKDGVTVVGEEVEIADGGRKVLSAKLEPARVAPAKDPLDRWFTVGTRWEGEAGITNSPGGTFAWWFTILSREGNKFKGRLVGEGRLDMTIEGTLGDAGTAFRWTNFRETPNIWRPHTEYESFTAEGKCMAERVRVDWKSQLNGQGVEGYCEFTIRREGPRKDDEEVWPPPLHPRRAVGGGKWSIQGEELVQESVEDVRALPAILFGDLGWKDYDFHLKAMRTAGDNGFSVVFDVLRPFKKVTHWEIGSDGNRNTFVQIIEAVPTGPKFTLLSERKPMTIVDNRWYDILIKTRGQWIECILDGQSVFKIPHPDRWGGKVAFVCLRMAGRFKDIEVTAPDGKVLWKKGPPELPSGN